MSILPTVTKIFERFMQSQLPVHISQCLSPFLYGYRTGFSTQAALLSLIERWKIMLHNKGCASTVLRELSKVFSTKNYKLLTAKLYTYGFSKKVRKLILSSLKHRKQRVKINATSSSWVDLIC